MGYPRPSTPDSIEIPFLRLNMSAVHRRPHRLLARYSVYFFASVALSGLPTTAYAENLPFGGTYVALYYGDSQMVVAADSKMATLDLSIEYDECKVVPLSDNIIFFALGVFGERDKFDIVDIARTAYAQAGSNPSLREVAEKWASLTSDALRNANIQNKDAYTSRIRQWGDIMTGWFGGITTDGKLSLYGTTLTSDDPNAFPQVINTKIVQRDSKKDAPFLYFGQTQTSLEFVENRTERARFSNEALSKMPNVGVTRAAIYVEALVKFVIEFSGDQFIGGRVPVLILDRDAGVRWFRRPDFCPEK